MPAVTPSRRPLARVLPLALLAAACADEATAPAARDSRPPRAALSLGPTAYDVVDLGALRADGQSWAYDISDAGKIVGAASVTAYPELTRTHAVRWSAGLALEDLGTAPGHDNAEARAINEAGQVAGTSSSYALGGPSRGVVWNAAGWSDAFGDLTTWAWAIGEDGAAYGQTVVSGHLVAYRRPAGGAMTPLIMPAYSTDSRVNAVNASGVAAGYGSDGSTSYAVRWSMAGAMTLPPLAPGLSATANGINGANVVVGSAKAADGNMHAVRWLPGGAIQDLGVLPGDYASAASGVNDAGEVVGTSFGTSRQRAFRWTVEGGMQELPALGTVPVSTAYAINADGDIVGASVNAAGRQHAALWRRVRNAAPVANAGGPYAGVEGSAITFSAQGSSDPDGDALTYAWSFGDDTPVQYGPTISRAWSDDGAYAVTLTVTDARGLSSEQTVPVTVANVPPSIRGITLDYAILNRPKAGQSWPLGVRWTDPGTLDGMWRWTIEWGDGTSTSGERGLPGEFTASHAYATAGARSVRITLRDKDGAVGTRSIPVDVQP